ncbi:MarR family transcriptional regulator [Acidovorax sp. CCYZU-2555]|uniref:MarR family winged helix-turn-helix transcriptional regulator n=1 Tax=Acidovorax sp. CCYZU-2555 TaxID=2835042 RepID=UPI001BCD0B9E|nr:MarR family transcriptional regulator [Acidovorax sp. CCYZU-2555]MBS7779663.1 MarR family transcriptional regulator [Acidovorax sp. CCYZU-2555]
MQEFEQKYQALLGEAQRRQWPGQDRIRLCFQTLSLAAAIDRDCARVLSGYGLSEGRFVLLFLLEAASAGLAPRELAEQAGVTRATVTGLLDGLERDTLVERQADAADRRALRVQLTPRGRQLAQSVVAEHGRWIAGVFGGLSVDERSQLAGLLEKVGAGLAARSEAGPP